MRNLIFLFVVAFLTCFLVAWSRGGQFQAKDGESSLCALADQALHDLQQAKVGAKREDLEKYFTPAGGVVFRNHTDYVYRKCDYLKIEVDFKADPAVEREFSPNDVITSVSRLFVAYPSRD